MSKYVISTNASVADWYELNEEEARKDIVALAEEYGHYESGESVSLFKDDELIAQATWDIEEKQYYECLI